jgi:DNA polymerase sigma
MEKVVCVSSAKVPIVKIWDPELNLACDMNVNNTLALENTRMVRTYVSIDDRVRRLAMIVKYWTRRRIINDAGSPPQPQLTMTAPVLTPVAQRLAEP